MHIECDIATPDLAAFDILLLLHLFCEVYFTICVRVNLCAV